MIIQNYEYRLMTKDPQIVYNEYQVVISSNSLDSTNPKVLSPNTNLYTALFFYTPKEAEYFLSIFSGVATFLDHDINGIYGLSATKEDLLSDVNPKSYVQRIACQSHIVAGSYSFQSTNKWRDVLITLDLYKVHGQLILTAYPAEFVPYPAKFIVDKFFEILIRFDQAKVLQQIELYKQLPIRSYFQQLIASLLDFQPVDIHGKTYWLNAEQRNNETLIETLKNESILEKL